MVSRRVALVVPLVAVGLGIGLDIGWLCAVGLLLTGALVAAPAAGGRGLSDVLAWIPAGAVVALAATTTTVVIGAVTGVPLWSMGRGPWLLALLTIALAWLGFRRGGSVALLSAASAVAWTPAAVVGGVLVSRLLHPMEYWSQPAWSVTDWVNNAEMTVDLVVHGLLEHSSAAQSAGGTPSIYPRGVHALLAWVVASTSDSASAAQAWEPVLAAVFGASAVATVLVLASASLLAVALARRVQAPFWVLVTAPAVTSLLLLHPQSYALIGASGFLTTAVATALLATAVLIADGGRSDRCYSTRVLLALALGVLTFHVWQLLAVPVVAVAGFLLVQWWRTGREHPKRVIAAVLWAAATCLPLTIVTLTEGGVEQAGAAGPTGMVDTATVAAVVSVALVTLLLLRRHVGVIAPAGLIAIGVTTVTGILFAAIGTPTIVGLPYYAEKLLWHAAALALPVATVGVTWLLVRAYRSEIWVRTSHPAVVRTLTLTVTVVLLAAYIGGGVSHGLASTIRTLGGPGGVSPQVPLALLGVAPRSGFEGLPVLPYLLHPQGWQVWLRYPDAQAAQVARTLGAQVPPLAALSSHRADEVCAWLRRNPDALRITGPRRGDQELIERGCPVEVVQPARWQVLVTPAEWWRYTRWAATDGAPDPAIVPPTVLLQ